MLALRRSLQCSLRNRAYLSTSTVARAGDSGKVKDLSAEEKKDPKYAGGLPEEGALAPSMWSTSFRS